MVPGTNARSCQHRLSHPCRRQLGRVGAPFARHDWRLYWDRLAGEMAKVQSGSYIHTYLQPKNVALQKRFFDRYLKGKDNGWEKEPRVEVEIRTAHNEVKRIVAGTCWPLPETQWTRWFLDAAG